MLKALSSQRFLPAALAVWLDGLARTPNLVMLRVPLPLSGGKV